MYQNILITLENGPADQTILDHIRPLARLTGARFDLLHVADGWAARKFEQLKLAESEEILADRAYLELRADELRAEGFTVTCTLAMGEPSVEIIKFVETHPIDLVAMSTHGHRFFKDIIFGSAADKVRHAVNVPVLLLKAKNLKAASVPSGKFTT